jgi:hypothetical protein
MDIPPLLVLRPALQLAGIGRRVVSWPVTSQQGSRRNAMLAATEIRQRRREQLEVEEFLAAVPPRRTAALG